MKKFKPFLAPNEEINLDEIKYPLLASTKLDGCRLLAYKGQLSTRSLKRMPNIQLNAKFDALRKYSEDNDVLLDGEIYAPEIPFQFIVSCFMTIDCFSKSAIKKWKELCEEHDFHMSREEVLKELKFYCFDCVKRDEFETSFIKRCMNIISIAKHFEEIMIYVEQIKVDNKSETEEFFENVLKEGYEGLILKDLNGIYKKGRGTYKEGLVYKLKPWVTEDSKIIGFIQGTKVNNDAEKTINELGRSRTSKCQDDRHAIEKASGFVVDFEGKNLTVPIAMRDEKKKYIWLHQDEYLGKHIEFKYMKVGMKKDGLPRIPKFIRMRQDKDDN